MGWRYYAHRVMTGEVLHTQLPLRNVSITRAVSAASSLTADLTSLSAAELVTERQPDGLPVFAPWATWITAEDESGRLRFGGPLTRPVAGARGSVECFGPRAWLGRQYFLNRYTARDIAAMHAMWRMFVDTKAGDLNLVLNGPPNAGARLGLAAEGEEATAENAYSLLRENGVNIGQEFDTVANMEPRVEYQESVRWVDRNAMRVEYALDCVFPRLGSRRNDIALDTAVNTSIDTASLGTGDEYANTIVGVGVGEGVKSAFHIEERGSADRLYPPVMMVVEDKSMDVRALKGAMQKAGNLARVPFRIPSAVVRGVNVGSWNLGDDIHVTARSGDAVFTQWCRIVAEQWSPDTLDRATLTFEPSESFTYGAA